MIIRKLRLLSILSALSLSLCALDPGSAQIIGPSNAIPCSVLAQATVATATASVVLTNASGSAIRGVAGKTIYICGWHVTATATTAATFQLVAGTDAASTPGCGGTQVILTPAFTVTNTAPATDHVDFASINIAPGQQLCVTTTGTTALQLGIWIGQY